MSSVPFIIAAGNPASNAGGRILIAIIGVIVAAVAFGLGYLLRQNMAKTRFKALHEESERILTDAKTKYREMELEAKDLAIRLREEAENENKRKRAELRVQEQRLQQRRESLDRRLDQLEAREKDILNKERAVDAKLAEAEQVNVRAVQELERVAGMDRQ
jgi:ribonucrease Y